MEVNEWWVDYSIDDSVHIEAAWQAGVTAFFLNQTREFVSLHHLVTDLGSNAHERHRVRHRVFHTG